MTIAASLTKPIVEVKYLTAENCYRYRPILRFFYQQYEKINYWMYKEDVFEAMRPETPFNNYTPEQCRQDLDTLVLWGNLIPMQDTSRASTVEEFKNKQFRYQLSEYSVEIERLTIKLENLHIEGASLEPTLFEKIRDAILKLDSMKTADLKLVAAWWGDLNADFIRLNQNYQDYIRSFNSLKAEERMKSKEFIVYKDALISYLREFVKGLQRNAYIIEESLHEIGEESANLVLLRVLDHEKSIPRLEQVVSEKEIFDLISGRWENLRNWFLGSVGRESEVSRVLDITNDIIRKVTRYASQISESRNSAANRKEEYKRLCELFLSTSNIDEAHVLSALSFGIFRTRHIKGEIIRSTESLSNSVYEEAPLIVEVKPRVRNYRQKSERNSIVDKSEKKQKLYDEYIAAIKIEKEIVEGYIKDGVLLLSDLPIIEAHVRLTILKWIGKSLNSQDKRGKTDDGRSYLLVFPKGEERTVLRCEDGELELPAFTLIFEGGVGYERA